MRRPRFHLLAALLLAACAVGRLARTGDASAARFGGSRVAADLGAPATHARPAAAVAFGEGRVPTRPGTDRSGGTPSLGAIVPAAQQATEFARGPSTYDRGATRDVRRDATHFLYFPTAPPSSI